MEYKEVEVEVSVCGYSMITFVDVPPDLDKNEVFRYILDQVELDYDDEWVRGV